MKLDFITAFYEPNPSPPHRNGYVCLPWLGTLFDALQIRL